MKLKVAFLVLFFYVSSSPALQFSAKAVMSSPNNADSSSKIFFSPGKIRKEYFYYGEPVIQILNSEKKRSWMCFSNQKLCYENILLEKIQVGISQMTENPCANDARLHCEKIGTEQLNKRETIKWKITQGKEKSKKVSYLWVDSELNIPVKNLFNNQSTIKMVWQGDEKLGLRDTQKWLEMIPTKDGKSIKKLQWFDKELKISIKQAYPDGSTQELKEISVEPLSEQLFEIPPGFAKQVTQ